MMDTKKCNNCGIEKHKTQDFPKNGRIYRAICKVCHANKQLERYVTNRDVHLQLKKTHYQANKDAICERNRMYRQEHREYLQNRDKILQNLKSKDYKLKRNKYLKERRMTDRQFAMVNAYRARLSEVLHKQKKNTYISYLSCKREEFLDWIEFQFWEGCSWDQYGKEWVIDHVIPVDFFNLEDKEHVHRCFAWFNLRPYKTSANLQKSNKIMLDEVQHHEKVLCRFKSFQSWYQADIEIYQWLREKLRYGNKPSVLGDSQPRV